MIKINSKGTSGIPNILLTLGIEATEGLQRRYDEGERNFRSEDFSSNIYGSTEVKTSLLFLQSDKCCFCESKIAHISYGDFEHFRPKAGWVQDTEALNKPGYYWLAYNWDNLLLCCQICNQRNKKNYFPLASNAVRAVSHHDDIAVEDHLFIHPVNENPEDYITFKEEIPVSINENEKGAITINKLGLDREKLNEQRRSTLNMVRHIYDLAKGYPDTYPELKREAKAIVESYYHASLSDATEYASMLRSFFRDNSLNF